MGRSLYFRLHAYEPDGTSLGMLPRPLSVDVDFQHDDAGTLKVTYSRLALGGDILKRGLEQGLAVGYEVSDGGAWTEPYNGRFVLVSRSRDAKDRSDTVTLNLMTYAWLLRKALLLDTSKLLTEGDNKGKRAFYSANPGTIVKTMLDENRGRDGVAGYIDAGFDTGMDSAGAAWANVMTLYYDPGVDCFTALSNLAANGVCDWRTQGMTLRIWNADSTALCRDLSGSVIIPLATQALESPEEETIENLAAHILVMGDGIDFTQDNQAAPTPWGKWELYSSQGGVSDEGTARLLMQTQLDQAARVRGQYTRSVLVNDVDALPLIDYRPGDWITAPTVSHGEKVRVQRITLNWSSSGVKAALILNDRLYDAQTRQAKRIQGITGGAVAGGAQGGRPAPAQDHRVPKAPGGLVLSTDAYLDSSGYARGLVTAGWGEVTQATDDTAIDIADYRVEWRYAEEDGWRAAGVTDGLTLAWSNLDCGRTVVARVRAIPSYSDRPGEWSDEASVRVASDAVPPSVPSEPVLSSEMGVVTIHWDGRNASGGGMEPDFDHLEVGRGSSAGALGVVSASMIDVDDFVDTNVQPGETWTYAFRAVDHAGNTSAWSATARITVASAVTSEQVEQIRQDLEDNDKAIEQAQKDLQDNRTALEEANRTVAQVQQDVKANQQTITQTQQTVGQVQNTLSQATKDIQSNKTALEQANKELDTVGRNASDAVAKAQQAIQDAAAAQTTADGRNRIFHDWQDPTVTTPSLEPNVGDLWYRYQRYWTTSLGEPDNSPSALADFYTYSEGEPDNSPSVLVTLDSEIVEVLVWDGSRWNTYSLVASNVIVSGTITGDLIAARTIVADNLATGSVTSEKIVSLAVTADKLAANCVNAGKIAAGAVTTEKLAAGAVTAAKIAALTITGDKIAASAISTDKIAANAVTSAKIAALAVTADKLAANSVNAGKIAAGAVTADKLAANSVNASKIVSGAVTADKLAANSVTAVKIAAGCITTDKIAAGQFRGYVFTGAVYQSSTAENTGFKLRDSGLDMWDSSHNHTVHLDGNGGSNLLTGTFQTAISGKRVLINPDFHTSIVGDPDNTQTGVGIQFIPDGSYARAPYIGTEFEDSDRGLISTICLNGGMRTDGSAGAGTGFGSFMRLGQYRNGGLESAEFYVLTKTDYLEKSSDTNRREWYTRIAAHNRSGNGSYAQLYAHRPGSRYANVYAWANDANNGGRTYSGIEASDQNGAVGVQACIDTGCLYLGGYLGGLTGRNTFQAAQWLYNNGTFQAGGNFNKAQFTLNPAKYGRYFAVASSDTDAYGIFLHVANTGGASSVQVMGRNAGDTFTGTLYAAVCAWLAQ
ncbi:hypothetical protein [Bifidobacterium phasiani]|uniref:Fibronectin type-III domain-containing protein n=1 Tax=Bifidobacterium phasiani TaxID=2834431 RepID=A0ABS6W8A2_9BIFI|nr:hypothetical protein [Bifidobacterium phasiani]MBW3081962.1 hypothetical protein [Bifidobacterium phasiani]